MYLKIVFFTLVLSSVCSYAKLSVDVYSGVDHAVKELQVSSVDEEPFLEGYFSKESIYNYYESNALNPYQSLFLDGVDQRFLDFDYNGFSLRDPSHPSGVFNIAAVLASTGNRKVSNKAVRLSVVNEHEEKSFVEVGFSHLGEASSVFQKNLCEEDFCYSLGGSLKRGGGFSQKSNGKEDDYFNRMDLNYSSVVYRSSYDDETYVFYSGQRYDEDSVGLFLSTEPESLNASSNGSILFLGKNYKFKNFGLRAFYMSSYRSQKNTDVPVKFSQRGEVLEVEGSFRSFSLRVFNERYDLFTSRDSDQGAELSYENKYKNLKYSLNVGTTDLRSDFGSVELGAGDLGFFAKAVPASLFQSSLNELSGKASLQTQNIFGLRYGKDILKTAKAKLNLRASYSRTFDFIDYDVVSNSYRNLNEVENALFKVEVSNKFLKAFYQYQIAKNIDDGRSLSQRPDWTLGLSGEKEFIRDFKAFGLVKYIGRRNAFDESPLESFWESSVALKYKSLTLSALNIFDESEDVYKGLGRRPLTLELKYQKSF